MEGQRLFDLRRWGQAYASSTINAFIGASKELDDAALSELEEILFSADVGVHTATTLLESVRDRLKRRELSDIGGEINRMLDYRAEVEEALRASESRFRQLFGAHRHL